jgi:hypothetical protein
VVQITISFLHSCVIHLNNEYHHEQSIFHSDQACPNWCEAGSKFSSPMSKFMYINACYVSIGVLKVHMLSYVHTRLQPSLHLSTLRFWTERKLVLYLTFSFQPKIQVLNMYKIYSTKNLEYPDFLQQWTCPLQISPMGLCLFLGDQ